MFWRSTLVLEVIHTLYSPIGMHLFLKWAWFCQHFGTFTQQFEMSQISKVTWGSQNIYTTTAQWTLWNGYNCSALFSVFASAHGSKSLMMQSLVIPHNLIRCSICQCRVCMKFHETPWLFQVTEKPNRSNCISILYCFTEVSKWFWHFIYILLTYCSIYEVP